MTRKGEGNSRSCSPACDAQLVDEDLDENFLRDVERIENISTRRTEAEVQRLAMQMVQRINVNEKTRKRVGYFWQTDEELGAVLLRLAHDIPRNKDPLDITGADEQIASPYIKQNSVIGDCVPWLGIVNAESKFAAIELRLPETCEPWYTFTNRLIVFLFADLPQYQGPDNFNSILGASQEGPLPMHCRNPL